MIGPAAVRRVATETGFPEEAVEKVLYLTAILGRLRTHPDLRNAWVLKGGTAINLFHLDVPRLSVDIDLNYIGQADLKAMQVARPGFERGLEACCEREGCQVRRAPGEHAGGKYRLRYIGGVGAAGSLEVDVNYVQRIPLLGVERRRPSLFFGGEAPKVPVLTLEELAAGKCAALLTRAAPRDVFDKTERCILCLLTIECALPGCASFDSMLRTPSTPGRAGGSRGWRISPTARPPTSPPAPQAVRR